jgi:hypothetical protein
MGLCAALKIAAPADGFVLSIYAQWDGVLSGAIVTELVLTRVVFSDMSSFEAAVNQRYGYAQPAVPPNVQGLPAGPNPQLAAQQPGAPNARVPAAGPNQQRASQQPGIRNVRGGVPPRDSPRTFSICKIVAVCVFAVLVVVALCSKRADTPVSTFERVACDLHVSSCVDNKMVYEVLLEKAAKVPEILHGLCESGVKFARKKLGLNVSSHSLVWPYDWYAMEITQEKSMFWKFMTAVVNSSTLYLNGATMGASRLWHDYTLGKI